MLAAVVDDLVTHGWVTAMVPAKTPAAVAEALNAAVNDVTQDPEVRHRLVNSELNPQRQSLADAAQFLRSELATWSRTVDAIAAVRAQKGLGLAEARALVDKIKNTRYAP